ncbi:hypothetical protein LBMAG27_20950 [Bacteroidota bacterium]|nr:hypothetical protein LBMAG27_20950 [Bacteroidota bacterium]
MLKINDKLILCNELKEFAAKETEAAIDMISLFNKKGDQTIIIHSWREGGSEIKLNDIIYIHSIKSNCFIHLINGTVKMHRRGISFYQKLLKNKVFIRVHQSYLVNQLYIEKIDSDFLSWVVLRNNEKIPILKRYEKLISEKLKSTIHSSN